MMESKTAEQVLQASERRLVEQSKALTLLTEHQASGPRPFADRLALLLQTAARTLGVERISLWRFDSSRAAIRCLRLYERTPDRLREGDVLHRADFPHYFAALEHERFIAAEDAHHDGRTREFSASYLTPLGIGAMLDVPIRQNDETVGVLCGEHVGGPRAWTLDEGNFALSVANLVAMALADEERRLALERLARSETRAQAILNTAHDAFVSMRSDGCIAEWNAQAEVTFGWTAREAIGQPLAALIIPPAYREAHQAGLHRFHETGEAPVVNRRLELTALHRDGREFPVEITITTPIPDEGGYLFSGFLRDISERRRQEEELRRAKEEAEAATRAKTDFLANMSHELRTPLNGVLGYAQLLQRDPSLTDSQRDGLETIAKCGSYLLELINDVLDLSRIEAGRLRHEPVQTDLRQVVADLERVHAPGAGRKGLLFELKVGPDVPSLTVLDGRHLRQVLLNLVGNAIKFTSTGVVSVQVAADGNRHLRFEVADTGPGIEPEHLGEIFQAFRQTRTGAAAGGTGLGLTISQRLVRAMGGTLAVESTLGAGSRFFFKLPFESADPSVRAGAYAPAVATGADARLAPGTHVTALVADDNAMNRHVLASLLESSGVHVITAAGGLEAVEHARRHRPDIILMDRRMRDLDGFEATRRIHADPDTAHTPVLAVSASAFSDSLDAARKAGCADFLPKPVQADVLYGMLQRYLGVTFVAGVATPPPAPLAPASIVLPPAQALALARRLRAAASVGDVTEIDLIAAGLMETSNGPHALGRRIVDLRAEFDFDALLRLADRLESREEMDGAVD